VNHGRTKRRPTSLRPHWSSPSDYQGGDDASCATSTRRTASQGRQLLLPAAPADPPRARDCAPAAVHRGARSRTRWDPRPAWSGCLIFPEHPESEVGDVATGEHPNIPAPRHCHPCTPAGWRLNDGVPDSQPVPPTLQWFAEPQLAWSAHDDRLHILEKGITLCGQPIDQREPSALDSRPCWLCLVVEAEEAAPVS
jgi:hypothetical protein